MKKIIYILAFIILLGSCGVQKSLLTQQNYDDVYLTKTPSTTQTHVAAKQQNKVTQKQVSNIPIDTLYADEYNATNKDTVAIAKSSRYEDYDLDGYGDYDDYYGDLYDYDLRLRLLYDGFYPFYDDWFWDYSYYY